MRFTEAHRHQLQTVGYTRVEGVIRRELTTAVLGALKDVSGVDYESPATWHDLPADYPGIIPSHHHQSQWDIRQDEALYRVFSELWETQALWVSMDRIGFVPPLRPTEVESSQLHWDLDPLGESTYQAIVYLTDVPPERAPFCAVPAIFQDFPGWLTRQPVPFDFASVDFSAEPWVSAAGHAGDLIIWNSRLPHGPGANRDSTPRVMQAVTMFPPSHARWTQDEQISWWRTKRAPPWWREVPGQVDPEPGAPAMLTDHGQRLVGLRPWEG